MGELLPGSNAHLIAARLHPSGFTRADSNFYSLSLASDGRLYYTLGSHDIATHARAYRYDPATERVELAVDFGAATGESGKKMLPQGKSHSPFFEFSGKLYFATQYGFFASANEKEEPGAIPAGYRQYPGGHILSYDLKSGAVEDLARAPEAQGIVTLGMDRERGRLYGLTWPGGLFLTYDLETRRLKNLGPVSRGGESASGAEYLCLCRSFAVYPRDGSVFFTNADGEVRRYLLDKERVETVTGLSLRRDIFGAWDPHRPGHQGYNWRVVVWHAGEQKFYGVHPRSGWLFVFDPERLSIELVERICCEPLRRNGRFEPFRYGYLSLHLAHDQETLYYLTGDYREPPLPGRLRKEFVHLVSYHLSSRDYRDHGILKLADGRFPLMAQTLASHPNGRLYSCPWLERTAHAPTESEDTHFGCELISFQAPCAG